MYILIGCVALSAIASYKIYQNPAMRALANTIKSYYYPPEVKQTIDHTNKVVEIEYKQDDRIYHLHLPYDENQRNKGLSKRVYLKSEHGTKEITQYPGIAYFMTAKQMGGYEIQIYDEDTAEINTLSADNTMFYD